MAVDTGTIAAPAIAPASDSVTRRLRTLAGPSTTTAGCVALLALTAVAAGLVLVASQHATFLTPPALPRSYPGWMAGPLQGLWDGAPSSRADLMALGSAAMIAMYASYLVVLACLAHLRARWVVGAIVVVHAVFLLAPPLSYTDIFNYLNYGRMGVLHGLNPYTTIPATEPHTDATFLISNWHHLASPYGPLFTLFTYLLVPLGVAVSFWVLKLVLVLASLTALVLLYRTAELLGRNGLRAVAYVGLNPLVLVWGLGGDHNDFLMMLLVMLAVYLVVLARERPDSPSRVEAWAGAAVVAACAIKASAAVMAPFLLLAAPHRGRLLRGAAVSAVIVGCVSLIAFGPHLPDLRTQSRLVTAIGLPNLLGLALGQGGETDTMRALVAVALVAVVGATVWWAWRRPGDWVIPATVAVLALVVSLTWVVPWYVLWVLPLAALWRAPQMRIAMLVLGVYLMVAFIPSAGSVLDAIHLRPDATALGRQHTQDINAVLR